MKLSQTFNLRNQTLMHTMGFLHFLLKKHLPYFEKKNSTHQISIIGSKHVAKNL